MSKSKPVGRPLSERPFAVHFRESDRAARQAHKAQCDIQEIMRVFNLTGQMPVNRPPVYMDCRVPTHPQAIAEHTIRMNQLFESLPISVRSRFPSLPQLASFLSDSKNHEEAVKLGLLTRKVSPAASAAVPAVPPASGGSTIPPEVPLSGGSSAPPPSPPKP